MATNKYQIQDEVTPLIVKIGYEDTRVKALKDLVGLCAKSEYRNELGLETCDFLRALTNVLQGNTLREESKETAATCVWWLASEHPFREYIGSRRLGLMAVMCEYLRQNSSSGTAKAYLNILLNCSLEKEIHAYWFTSDLHISQLIVDLWRQDISSTLCCRIFRNLLKDLDDDYFHYYIELRIHEIAISNLFIGGSNPLNWKDRVNGVLYYSLIMLVDFLSHPEGAIAANSSELLNYLYALVENTDAEGLRACYCLAFLVGREEGNAEAKAILESHPKIVDMLLAIFDFTVAMRSKEDGTGVPFGIFTMRVIMGGLKALALSDANKRVLIRCGTLLPMILKVLRLYVEDSPRLETFYNNLHEYAGGGGKDIKTAENTIELLLQLSYFYNDDAELRNKYMRPELGIVQLLNSVLRIPNDRSVSTQHKYQVQILLNRLVDPNTVSESVRKLSVPVLAEPADFTPSSQDRKHIVISYSWAANKHLVVQLATQLRELGYDVWNDEDGSSLVGPAYGSGNIVDTVAKALQSSYAVIICVSPQYKDDGNCRLEARYCQALAASGKVKLIYVMMNQDYHTKSNRVVDGWLGSLIGSANWYPLWDASNVVSTANSIASVVGNQAKLPLGGQPYHIGQINTIVAAAEPITATAHIISNESKEPAPSLKIVDYKKAFQTLKDPNSSKDPSKLTALLDELGLTEHHELELLDPEHIDAIVDCLKPVKRNLFLVAMGLK